MAGRATRLLPWLFSHNTLTDLVLVNVTAGVMPVVVTNRCVCCLAYPSVTASNNLVAPFFSLVM